ncbi:MAG: hypothetical protein Q8J74_11480 [Candidatus Didemnitutus sp.]|nr:hypothetical protein [Candidatus Didemnitutus sp.]
MDLFLAHSLLLLWASLGAARKLVLHTADRILAAALLAWGNIVATSLVLSCGHRLGEPVFFFGTSLLLAALTTLAVWIIPTATPAPISVPVAGDKTSAWLGAALLLTLVPLAAAQIWIAWTYQPGGEGALSYHLPRTMYYLGQDTLAHFDASDLRQTRLPFNFNLLQAFGLIYGPPLQILNLFSLMAWVCSGLAVYRLCRQWACSGNASLLTAWLVLNAPPVLTAAASATPNLAGVAALASAGVFALQWQRTGQHRQAVLAGLALGLAAGSSLGLFFLTPVLLLGAGWLARKRSDLIRGWIVPTALAVVISVPFAVINLVETGKLLEPGLMLSQWRSSDLREFLLLLLILSPCLAVIFDHLAVGPRARRAVGWTLGLALALVTSWLGATDLLVRLGRPLGTLLKSDFVPSGPPTLPLLLEFRLKDQPRINIDTDGANESIFTLMAQVHHERVTSQDHVAPDAYNLLSRATLSRNASYLNARGLPSYTLVPIPAKRSAGVEFLATIGSGPAARDYLGLVPRAGEAVPHDSNRNLLITLTYGPRSADQTADARIAVAGLNPEDRARLTVIQENDDGSTVPLAVFGESGAAHASISPPFSRLLFKVVDASDNSELGLTVLPYAPSATENQPPIDPLQPSSAASIFVTDAIVSRRSDVISYDGLLAVEGPFPQWNLPSIRWAKQPSVLVTIPATRQLARLVVSFSVQPQVRHEAGLELFFNGRLVGRYQLKERTVWLDQTLELVPRAGKNVLEFRDATFGTELDWLDYLEQNPDVKSHLLAQGISLEPGAREHFETHGKTEGRPNRMRQTNERVPAPSSYYFIYRALRIEGFRS